MPGLLRMAGRTAVIAGTATAVSGRVARRQSNRWAEQEEQQQQQESAQQQPAPAPAPAPAPESGTSDMLAQLQQLGELKQSGVLTDAEFEAQKQKILSGS
jgi:Short C-terminal domain